MLDDASALIRDEAGATWDVTADPPEVVPEVVRTVCLSAAQRAFLTPTASTRCRSTATPRPSRPDRPTST
jgi:hypothetical protein